MDTDWLRPMAWALTGQDIGGGRGPVGPGVDELAAALGELGWTAPRLSALRAGELAAERPWPHTPPAAVRGDIGFAQFAAVRTALIERLGLRSTRLSRPHARPDSADRRLMAERPPHW